MMNAQAKRTLLSSTLAATLSLVSVVALAESVERELETSDSPTVSIELDSGDLTVVTWQENKVRIEGELSDDIETFEVELNSKNAIDIMIEDEDRSYGRGDSTTKLIITLPVKSHVSVETITGAITVSGLEGSLDVESVNGPIDISSIRGRATLEGINGPIIGRDLTGDLDLDSVNGPIRVVEHSGKRVKISTVNGAIYLESTAADVDLDSVSGPAKLLLGNVDRFAASSIAGGIHGQMHLEPRGNLDVETVSGRVRLTLLEPLDISVNVESMTGSIDNELSSVEPERGDFGLGRSLNFTEGDASAEVRITTVSGEVDLRKE